MLDRTARTTSNALLYGQRVTSNVIPLLTALTRTTSNALLPLRPTDLNGTVGLVYKAKNFVFHQGEQLVRGFLRFNDGFTILQNASAVFDTWVTVSGSIDLRETGSLVLNGSLNLGSAFTFTSGGNILGCGHAIIMGGDLTLADTGFVRVLHVRNDLILDGQGKTFIVGDRAQLFVDSNVSLTLRHMTLRTSPDLRQRRRLG